MADAEFNFDEFDEEFDSNAAAKKKEEKIPKATDGEVTEIGGKETTPHYVPYEIDDMIEPTDFDLITRVAEFLDAHDTKLLKCVIVEAKIVTGRSDYPSSAFVRISTDYPKDKKGEWCRTSSLAFKEQVDSLIEKKSFPINVRLAEKRNQLGKAYYVLNG